MSEIDAAFGHHVAQVTVAEFVGNVPAYLICLLHYNPPLEAESPFGCLVQGDDTADGSTKSEHRQKLE
jgi:hypothetical protein